MDINEKLDEISKDVKEMRKENLEAHGSIAIILISMRDNTWHQFETIRRHLMKLFNWDKPE
jgi:hypothetical protein